MKKLAILLTSAILLFASAANASASGFLVKAGLNFPSLDLKDVKSFDFKSYTGWHIGAGFQTGSIAGFSLQPELVFTRNGVNVTNASVTETVRTNMLQLIPNIQWGINLLICKPFLFVAPYAALNLSTSGSYESGSEMKNLIEKAKKLDYGIGVGAGLNIWKLQVTGKYTWAFGNVLDWNEYKTQVKDIKLSNGAFVLSAAYQF